MRLFAFNQKEFLV